MYKDSQPTRWKIIIVDDVNYTLQATKNRLKKHYQVFVAQSTNRLFEYLELFIPDLILLDINMPHIDGFETIKMLKEHPPTSGIPVVFVTSQKEKSVVIKGMSMGAVDFVFKPFSDNKLIDCIEHHLNPDLKDTYRPKILAVDDHPSVLKSLSYTLSSQYTVYTLNDPKKLEKLLEDIKPDMFLLDYNMPDLNGFQLSTFIRKSLIFSTTPIIMITAEGTLDRIMDASCYGMTDFIVKPYTDAILREKVALHLVNHMFWRRVI
jgi:PleD family two-component response regulator